MSDITDKEIKAACVFISPLIVLIFLFILVPVLGTLLNSMFQDVAFLDKQFVFLRNFRQLFADSGFRQALKFTLLFVLVSVPIEIVLGMAFAMLMNTHIPLRGLLRACVLIPWAIPAAVSGRIWELIYNYSYGLANFIFTELGITTEPVNWLGTSLGAFIAVVIADVWKTTPFAAIILLAGLQAIPVELLNQARVDRANFLQVFYKVVLPLMKPIIIVALLFRTIDGLRVFDLIYVLSGGGPGGATTSISHYAYKYFLGGDFGYGSAVSVILFMIAFLLSVFYVKAGRFMTGQV
ncbi:MAG: sugar ABC transporter permease [Sedimentisphaerales bacterium]|nr:sugar ABC transporter permease [Sedimentisphaerales bacterium]